MSRHVITIIGTGMGPADLAAEAREAREATEAREALAQADVLVGGKRFLDAYATEKIIIGADVPAVLDAAEIAARSGKRVVVLASGDPLFFGIGAAFAERFGAENLRIFPAVSSLQEAAARLALPWNNVTPVSLHGREGMLAMLSLAHALLQGGPLCVLTDGTRTPAHIAAYMTERGRTRYTAAVLARLGMPDETVWRGTLAELLYGGPSQQECPAPNVLFLLPDTGGEPSSLCLGRGDDDFAHEKSLITKWPVRAAALAALRIEPAHTVWDLGAGSGAVAVEAASLAYRGHVVAVEKDAARVTHIAENRRRFGAANLDITHAAIHSALPALPAPHRVFIGGGLGASDEETTDTLQTVWTRLLPGGRIVISCVLLSSLEKAKKTLQSFDAPFTITQVQTSTAAPLGDDVHLRAANPVFLLSAQK
ncbi:MAG: Cobalamin biosynthesis bifunctional protein CbiET [Desulfovibrio sp.]